MKKSTKTLIGVAAAGVLAVASLTPVLVNAWGDSNNGRQFYTLEQVNAGDLGDKIVFNSITNDQVIGDEQNFVGAKSAEEMAVEGSKWHPNEINVKDGETYTIRLYVHNNSPLGEKAVATGVNARFSLPTTVAKSHEIVGYLKADNSDPKVVWDEVTLKSDDDFYLEYVGGSASYYNNIGTFPLSNDVVVEPGVALGYTSMDGKIPGCFKYSGQVTIQVKVHKSVTSKFSKVVRKKGDTNWSESVNAKVGDEVEYQIEYQNLLAEQVDNVMIRDILPTNVEYVPGSTVLLNSNYKEKDGGLKVDVDTVTTSGINIGSYAPKAQAFVRFTGKVVDKTLACGSNQLVNWANVTVNNSVTGKDDASVMVNKVCENQPSTPGTTTPTTPSTPSVETPKEIVATGPEMIVSGALGAGSVVTAAGYYLASRKKLM